MPESILFAPVVINGMKIRNRFVRSATGDGAAERNGHVSERQLALFGALARGGAGLIVTGLTYVHPSGQNSFFQLSAATDDRISGLKNLSRVAHSFGAKIAPQLFHAGREAARFRYLFSEEALAPSAPQKFSSYENSRMLAEEEIRSVIHSFGQAARRVQEAGCDGVQVHGGHGYLLSQFLSPVTNHRSDQWGGSLANRLRMHLEIAQEIRRQVGKDFPVLLKLGVQDGHAGGLEFGEGLEAAIALAEAGYDAIEITQGLRGKKYEGTEYRPNIDSVLKEGYFRNWCREIRKQVSVPVIMVGGLRTFDLMEEIVRSGDADLVSLSRPLIREPRLIREWQKGSRQRAACISCNFCLEELRRFGMTHCKFDRREQTLRMSPGEY